MLLNGVFEVKIFVTSFVFIVLFTFSNCGDPTDTCEQICLPGEELCTENLDEIIKCQKQDGCYVNSFVKSCVEEGKICAFSSKGDYFRECVCEFVECNSVCCEENQICDTDVCVDQ